MRRATLLFALLLAIPPTPVEAQSDAEKLATLSGAGFFGRGATVERFEFLLSEYAQMCTNEAGAASMADRMYFLYQELEKGGLGSTEGLLDFANNLYDVARHFVYGAQLRGSPNLCTEAWTMYVTLRVGSRNTPAEAIAGLKELAHLFGGG